MEFNECARQAELMPQVLEDHCRRVLKRMVDGRVIPLLGAGINLCGRPSQVRWKVGEYLPSGSELARDLAEYFDYPDSDALELVRVSEYASVMNGSGPLYERLRGVFDADYPIGPLHRLLARLPRMLEKSGQQRRGQIIMTTNYDDALERAFREIGEPFDLLCYIADGEDRGSFVHVRPDGAATVIERPNEYLGLHPDQQTVILKIHGTVDRFGGDGQWDSFVITEDHYIDYLTHTEISTFLPANLVALLKQSHFLFLGYSMRDWNLRVILHRIWGEQKLKYKSWAVQRDPSELDREFWERRGVDVLDVSLETYLDVFAQTLRLPEPAPAGP